MTTRRLGPIAEEKPAKLAVAIPGELIQELRAYA